MTPSKDREEFWDGDVPWVSPKDMKVSVLHDSIDHVTEQALAETGLKLHAVDSVMVVTRGMILAHTFPVARNAVPVTINQDMKALRPRAGMDARYLAWMLVGLESLMLSLTDESAHGTKALRTDQWENLPIPVPSPAVQTSIADFLDAQTARIDLLIAEKERLLSHLVELHVAALWSLVTKGTNSAVELKTSNSLWLGAVPRHWSIKKLKWISPVLRGASPRPIDDAKYFDEDGEYAWVRIADVSASDGWLLKTEQRLSELGASLSVKREPGDLFLSIAGTVGKPCIATIKCCIHDGFVWFPSLGHGPLRDWLFTIFEAGFAYAGLGKMGTQLNLNTDTVGGIEIPVPPDQEMTEILEDVAKSKLANKALQVHVTKHLERLREYRSSLISAAVTGQLDIGEFKEAA